MLAEITSVPEMVAVAEVERLLLNAGKLLLGIEERDEMTRRANMILNVVLFAVVL